MSKVTYLPGEHDNPETHVGGVKFVADETVEVHDTGLVAKLANNPFFWVGEDPPASPKKVKAKVHARDKVEALKAEIGRLVKEHDLESEEEW